MTFSRSSLPGKCALNGAGWGGDGEGPLRDLTPEGLELPKLFSYALVLGKVGNPANSLLSGQAA